MFFRVMACLVLVLGWSASSFGQAFTLFHTNDLHSQYHPEPSVYHLGGIGRLMTMIERLKETYPESIVVDGGDWSEGGIYYTLDTGTQNLSVMGMMGYDAVVIGNHDWLNGPDILLSAIQHASPPFALLAANLDLTQYAQQEQFREVVKPFTIIHREGLKIGIIGLATYELIWDQFFRPVRTMPFFNLTRQLAKSLRPQVDLLVVISHNLFYVNEKLAKAIPDIDVIVGGHGHDILLPPHRVDHPEGTHTWILEAGAFGAYLGQLDLDVQKGIPRAQGIHLRKYQLHPVHPGWTSNAQLASKIQQLEAKLVQQHGDIFTDTVAVSEIEVSRYGVENEAGNLVADAYLDYSKADLALDHVSFIPGHLSEGTIHSVDVFNLIPAVYHPTDKRSWNLMTFEIKGKDLQWVFNLLGFTLGYVPDTMAFSISGAQMIYKKAPPHRSKNKDESNTDTFFENIPSSLHFPRTPFDLADSKSFMKEDGFTIQKLFIQGKPLDVNRTYTLATSEGIVQTIRFINSWLPNTLPLPRLKTLNTEDWKIVRSYLSRLSPLQVDKVQVGNRMVTEAPDLSVNQNRITLEKLPNNTVRITANVRNNGAAVNPNGNASIQLLADLHGHALSPIEQKPTVAGETFPIPELPPGESQTFQWTLPIPRDLGESTPLAVGVQVHGPPEEIQPSNNAAIKHFQMSDLR